MSKRYFAFISFFTFVVLLFVSHDSYFYDLYAHMDTTAFQFFGKAMMNGMVPYIDFNESKGPLLFLLYGIGYLISPYDFIGMFWISVLAYIIIYYYTYKTAALIVKDRKNALLISILMTFFYFNPMVQFEVKTESFAQVFIIISLYYTLRYVWDYENTNTKIAAFVLGACFAACCLMKVNIGALIGVFILYSMFYVLKRKETIKGLTFGILGAAVICVPFTLYFIANDAFPQCISEFWYAMTFTIGNYSKEATYWQKIFGFFMDIVAMSTFFCIFAGLILFKKRYSKLGWFPILTFPLFFFAVLQAGAFHYYYISCNVFYIFPLCAITKNVKAPRKFMIPTAFITLILVSSVNIARCWIGSATEDFFLQDTPLRQGFYRYAYLMAQIEKPSYVTDGFPESWDVATDALPGCKYPGRINGEPENVTKIRMNAIKSGVDFVLVHRDNEDLSKQLLAWGYKRYNYGKENLFTRHELQEAPSNFYVSAWDILLKRDVLKGIRGKRSTAVPLEKNI